MFGIAYQFREGVYYTVESITNCKLWTKHGYENELTFNYREIASLRFEQ
jgi:hypothetical protein